MYTRELGACSNVNVVLTIVDANFALNKATITFNATVPSLKLAQLLMRT